jgi:hypothetical protein
LRSFICLAEQALYVLAEDEANRRLVRRMAKEVIDQVYDPRVEPGIPHPVQVALGKALHPG